MRRNFRELSRTVSEYTLVTPYVLPPKENVIQGLCKPDPSPKRLFRKVQGNNGSNHSERGRHLNGTCQSCDFWDKKYGYCLIKRMNKDGNSECPEKSFMEDFLSRRCLNGFCQFCDFWDRQSGCLIKRMNGKDGEFACPHINGQSNIRFEVPASIRRSQRRDFCE